MPVCTAAEIIIGIWIMWQIATGIYDYARIRRLRTLKGCTGTLYALDGRLGRVRVDTQPSTCLPCFLVGNASLAADQTVRIMGYDADMMRLFVEPA